MEDDNLDIGGGTESEKVDENRKGQRNRQKIMSTRKDDVVNNGW